IIAPVELELVADPCLERALVVAKQEVVRSRRGRAATGIPGSVVPVEPVEDVERFEIDGELVTPRHLERLGDTKVETFVADRLLRIEHAAEVAVAARTIGRGGTAVPWRGDVAEGGSARQRQRTRHNDVERGPINGRSHRTPLWNAIDVGRPINAKFGAVVEFVAI